MVHFNFNLVSWKYIGFKAYPLSFALQLLSLTSQVCTLPCHFDFLREEWTSSFCCCSLAACSGLTGSVAMLGPRSGLLVSLQTGRRQGNPQTQIQGWREESWEESRLEWKTPHGRWDLFLIACVRQDRVGQWSGIRQPVWCHPLNVQPSWSHNIILSCQSVSNLPFQVFCTRLKWLSLFWWYSSRCHWGTSWWASPTSVAGPSSPPTGCSLLPTASTASPQSSMRWWQVGAVVSQNFSERKMWQGNHNLMWPDILVLTGCDRWAQLAPTRPARGSATSEGALHPPKLHLEWQGWFLFDGRLVSWLVGWFVD